MRTYGGSLGRKEKPDRCVYEVTGGHKGWFHQCTRYRGYGPNKAYCKAHSTAWNRVFNTPEDTP